MGKDEKIIIVAHSHWDREWYMSEQLFRFRLVAMIDRLLHILETDKDFHSFMLDGQTCLLEDYIQIRPGNKARLEKLVKAGRIIIGPFYMQNSPWLQTGEGYVRNLLRGYLVSEQWGATPMKVGYIPDQYIHFEQMPQVFQGFGINAMAFSRGMGNQQEEHDLGFEFEWKAPDGSSVLALHLTAGYGQCNPLVDDPELAVDTMVFSKGRLNAIKKATRWTLMFCGDDHRVPEKNLPAAIKQWNEIDELVEEEGTIKQGTLEEYVKCVLAENPVLPTYIGEIRGARYALNFQGVYSSCMPLKKQNFLIHDMLERYAEPLSMLSRIITQNDYRGFLSTAWRMLLLNQPHDSSWTASWDPVMDDMETRFRWAMENAMETRNWAFLDLTSRIKMDRGSEDQVEIVIFNPLQHDRREPVSVVVPTNFKLEDRYALMDASGTYMASTYEPVPLSNETIRLVRKFVGSHGPRPRYYYRLHVTNVDVPAVGYTTLILLPDVKKPANEEKEKGKEKEKEKDKEKEKEPPVPNSDTVGPSPSVALVASDSGMENDVIKLEIQKNGTLKITDKVSGHVYGGMNLYEDISDVGDGYEFKPIPGDVPITSNACEAKMKLLSNSGFDATCRVQVSIDIPERANKECTWRSDTTKPLEITTFITMYAGSSPRIDIKVQFENLATDHRVSCTLPTGLRATDVLVDGHFGLTRRKIRLPPSEKWKVKPVPQAPQHRFIVLPDYSEQKGILVANRGLTEYEATVQEDETIMLGLTLMRAFGGWGRHINPDSVVTVEYPQLLGWHEYEYSLIPFQGDFLKSAYQHAIEYRYPLHAEFLAPHNKYQGHFPNIEQPQASLPLSRSFFKLEPGTLVLSCIKLAERSDDVIVRLFNISRTEAIQGRLETALNVHVVEQVDLNEHAVEGTNVTLDGDLGAILLNVPPSKIVTLKLTLKK